MHHRKTLICAAIAAVLAVPAFRYAHSGQTNAAAMRATAAAQSTSMPRNRAVPVAAPRAMSHAQMPSSSAAAGRHDWRPALNVAGAAADATPMAQRARALLKTTASSAAHRAEGDQFVARDVIVDRRGIEHVRMDRTYQGLKVIGGDLVLHSRNGTFVGIDGTLKTALRPNLDARLSSQNAMAIAAAGFDGKIDRVSDAGLVVYAGKHSKPALARDVRLFGVSSVEGAADMHYFIDANDGKVLGQRNEIKTIARNGVGHSLTMGEVDLTTDSVAGGFRMVDPTRGGNETRDGNDVNFSRLVDWVLGGKMDLQRALNLMPVLTSESNVWGDGTESTLETIAVDVHYSVAKTWDYYMDRFSRSGVSGDGRGIRSLVGMQFEDNRGRITRANASWSNALKIMAYGVGEGDLRPMVSLDIAAHEMTHGVVGSTANLGGEYESSSLNEATADIMATAIERYVQNGNDPADYLIGENVTRKQFALRSLFMPSMDGNSTDCWFPQMQDSVDDPHLAAGVANHFFYLLSEGTAEKEIGGVRHFSRTCDASDTRVAQGDGTMEGIGIDDAAGIWYAALTQYMTSDSGFDDARAATLKAAADAFGEDSTQYVAVAAAWDAVNVKGAEEGGDEEDADV